MRLLVLLLIAPVSFGQTSTSVIKVESNAIFFKLKNQSNEYVVYPTAGRDVTINSELKKIIETYKINSIRPTFRATAKTDPRLKQVYTLTFPSSTQREAIISALQKISFVEYAEAIPTYEVFLTPNDVNSQQWNLPKINASQAWDFTTGSSKVIAIVDDAVRLTHEDLAANIWNNPLEIAGNGIDDDGNGYIDDVNGYDVADDDNNPMTPATATNSEFTHGTHCSGIAAGVTNNGVGIASIGFNNKIMAVKCKPSSDLGGSLPYAYTGLAYAIDAGADVISMSWGGYYYSATYQLLFDVAYDAGIVCVAAAGNSDTDVPMYPASYNHVISVAATNQNDIKASFSNYGSTIDVSAPGVNIYSTLAGSNNAYGMLSGTSMACPLVSGLCALMLSYNPLLTPDELERCLKDNATNIDNLNPSYTGLLGAGRIDAYLSMLCLQKEPIAEFDVDKQLVCPGQTVNYRDLSSLGSNTGVSWSWSFPGGTPSTSTLQNPTVVYNTAGTYSATLTVTNSFGNDVETKTNYVTVTSLTATLSGTATIPTGGSATLRIDFSNSVGPFSITYTDGTTPVTKNNITSNPYYFTVSPTQTSTYSLTAVSNGFCTGTYSGSAIVNVGGLPTTNCSGVASVMFERVYGNATHNYANNILQSSTGEYYLIGLNDAGTTASNFTLSKLDGLWNIVWTKAIGTSSTETLNKSIKTSDGNIIVCGTSTINGALDAYVVKIDFNGNILWSKTYGGSSSEYAYGIQNTSDGGYVIAGRAESFSGILDSYIIKIDVSGNVQWTRVFGRDANDYAFSCVETSDGGYISISASHRIANSNYDYLITKLTSTGTISWSKYYGDINDEGPRELIVTSDGGFLIGGTSRYRGTGLDAMLTKVDASGNLLWSKTFGGNGTEEVFVVKESNDGNYMVAGFTDSYGAGGNDIFFNKFDTNGNIIWSKLYGGSQNDNFAAFGSIINSSDNGYFLTGTTTSYGAGGADMYLIKTDCNGSTNCTSRDVTFQFYDFPPTLLPVTLTTNQTGTGTSTPSASSTNLTISSSAVCLTGLPTTDCSGTPSVKFERAIGTSLNETGVGLLKSNAGDYYIVGASDDFYITKLNSSYAVQWTKKFGTTSTEVIYQSVATTDGGIISCGYNTIAGNQDVYVVKTDLNGNLLWSKTYGGSGSEFGFNIQNTADGGYVIAGRTDSYGGGLDCYLIKINATGTIQWSKAFGRSGNDYIMNCYQTPDGGYITSGSSQAVAYSNYDWIITKLDASGSVVWTKCIGSSLDDGCRRMIVTSDGGYLCAGHSRYRNSNSDALVIKLDASGNIQWSKSYGGAGNEDMYVVSETADGNYILGGFTDSFGAGNFDVFLSKFDTNGNVLWDKIYGGAQAETILSGQILNTADNGYMFVCTSGSYGAGGNDALIIKTDCNGNSSCTSSNVTFEYYTPTLVMNTFTATSVNAPGSATPSTVTSTASNFIYNSACPNTACTINAAFNSNKITLCKGDMANFTSTSTGATTYKWYVGNTLITQNVTTAAHTFSNIGDYLVVLVADNGNCSDSDTLTIRVRDFPQLHVSNDTTICNTTSANLLVSGATSYSWTSSPSLSCTSCANPIATPASTQYYVVTGTDANGCKSKDSVKVMVKCCVNGIVSPKAGFSFSDTTICVNDIITITNLSYTSINNVSAEWDFSSTAVPSSSTALQPGNIQFTQSGRWPIKLIITDDCGKDTIVNYINVFNPPVVEPYPNVYLCTPPGRVQMDVTPISDFTYRWTPSFGLSDSTIANPWVDITDTLIRYRRTVTDNITGCSTSDLVRVSSHTGYRIQAMNDTTIHGGDQVQLKACCGNLTWWPTSYFTNAGSQNPIAAPNQSIWYFVQSTDTIGCIAKDSVLITVLVAEPFIPNLVTPNGDQNNDTFEILNLCPQSEVEIYNRWGDLIYKTNDYKNEWNGKNQTEGMYFVSFKSGCGGKLYKGWIHLVKTE
ncbi:MAG: S8 family serine peptidase [Cytophagaceae bacterium]